MTIEDKKKVYDTLDKSQKEELKETSKYFNSMMWLVEPSEELFGVEWTQTDLNKII